MPGIIFGGPCILVDVEKTGLHTDAETGFLPAWRDTGRHSAPMFANFA
jgi:hypothetical protein